MSLLVLYGSGGGVQRSLTADPESLALTGIAATFKFAYKETGTPASLSLTGIAGTLPVSKKLTGQEQTLTLTGTSASTRISYVLGGTVQSLSLTGSVGYTTYGYPLMGGPIPSIGAFGGYQGAGTNYPLTGTSQSLTLTGSSATVKKALKVTGTSTALSLTGSAATPLYQIPLYPCFLPSIGMFGGIQGESVANSLSASPEALSLTGSSGTFKFQYKLIGTSTALVLTGIAGTFVRALKFVGTPEVLTLTGSNATFGTGVGTDYSLECLPQALTLTGTAAAAVAILEQVRVFDARYRGNSWVWEYGTYPPGFDYYLVAINSGVSTLPFSADTVSDVGHKVTDNGDGTVTLEDQISVSTDKTDAVTVVNYEIIE